MRVYTLSNLVLVHFAENFSLCSKRFQSSYCTKVGFPSLPSPSPFIPFVCSRPNSLDALARKRLLRRLRKRLQNAFSLFTLKQNGPLSSVEANLVPRAFPWKGPFPAPPNFLREKHWGRGCAATLEAGAGKKENRKRAGHDGKGIEKGEGEPIPSSHRAPRAFYFSMYCYFYWDTQWKSLRRREKTACIVMRISMFFFIFVGCLSPLGMKSRFIKDGQISASSSMSDLQLPSAGRLHNTA